MKIVQVAHGYPPYALAGVEVYTRWFARTLSERHGVRVFTTRHIPEAEDLSLHEETLDGVDVTFLANHFTDYDPILEVRHEKIAERFADFLDRDPPDVVHFQHLIKFSTTLLDVCRERGIATVLTLHDYWFLCPVITLVHRNLEVCKTPGDIEACTRCEMATSYLNREEAGTYYIAGMLEPMMAPDKWRELNRIYDGDFSTVYAPEDTTGPALSRLRIGLIRRFMRDRLDAATILASPSRFLKGILEGHGLAPGRIEHMPNGIDHTALEEAGSAAPPPPLRVLYLGTINKHKGVHVLLEAANELEGADIAFSIYGTGPDEKYEDYIRSIVRNPAVHFGGRYDRDDLPGLLESHHVVVMPSIWYENYPIVIREAFAAGVPVVAPDLGAMPEAIRDGVDGILYPHADSAALATVLRRLLSEDGLLARLRDGIEPVLGLREHIGRYETLYDRACAALAGADSSPTPSGGRRILLLGEASSRTDFARVLGDLLAATADPRPTVHRVASDASSGDLAESLATWRTRLGLDAMLPVVPDDPSLASFDLVVVLDGATIAPAALDQASNVKILRGAPSHDEIIRALA